ncbi:hypothetical protein PHSY_000785 [Pseudozyma hubeiensis SY62]|uniref:Uncharacterized protein n=1 Tax=Pseudozyma hubeiensis (strain SY62) TaxID=1305764 RepID=R9NXE1_PSEHS|nr:hypothetical protein PHSY_000785 [Pseudozyma hubeiensis SY62]GAC93222.1 hypothetical protein PHSY_000785 [Pseudozyma hubeiensis SY62]
MASASSLADPVSGSESDVEEDGEEECDEELECIAVVERHRCSGEAFDLDGEVRADDRIAMSRTRDEEGVDAICLDSLLTARSIYNFEYHRKQKGDTGDNTVTGCPERG